MSGQLGLRTRLCASGLKSWEHLALSKVGSGLTHSWTPGLCKAVLGHEEETFYEMSENRVESVGEAIGRQMLIEKS